MRLLIAIAAMALAITSAKATQFYDHNGSLMRVEFSQGRGVAIYYERPRSGLARIGVTPGRLLFKGRTNGAGYLEGMSRIFSTRCGEVDYFVYGDFTPGQPFRLDGAAPVLARDSCAIIDNVHDGKNSKLVFTPVRTAPTPSPQRNPQTSNVAGTACVIRVRPGSTLNMRAGPSTEFGVVAEIPAGACGVEIGPSCRGSWCGVRYRGAQGFVGWVNTNYLQRN
ncbi:MAG: hypothetical protein AAF940_04905 [Pseudomonadota bacterium]